MKTKECTVYICEHCGQLYKDLKTVTRCLERCAKKKELRLQWFKANPPKYKVGDFIYTLPGGGTIEVESITKHPKDNCWRYHGLDESGWNNWFSSLYAKLLLPRLEADSRKREIRDRLQGYTIEDIFFAAIVKHTASDVGVVDIETRIDIRDKGRPWKQ